MVRSTAISTFRPSSFDPIAPIATCSNHAAGARGRYRPNLAIAFLTQELAFDDGDDTLAFLVEEGAVLTADQTMLECKETLAALPS